MTASLSFLFAFPVPFHVGLSVGFSPYAFLFVFLVASPRILFCLLFGGFPTYAFPVPFHVGFSVGFHVFSLFCVLSPYAFPLAAQVYSPLFPLFVPEQEVDSAPLASVPRIYSERNATRPRPQGVL